MNIKNMFKYSHYIISFSQSNYMEKVAGTEKFIMEQSNIFYKNKISYMHVFPIKLKSFFLGYGVNIDEKYIGCFSIDELVEIIRLSIDNDIIPLDFHIHHLLHYSVDELAKLIKLFDIDVKFYIHDYYTVCNQINMLKNDECFCGEGSINDLKCNDCKYYNISKERILKLKVFFEELEDKILFITPSESTKQIWSSAWEKYKKCIIVIPHLKLKKSTISIKKQTNKKVRIAYVGGQAKNKGFNIWKQFVEKYADKDEYELFYFGNPIEKLDNVKNITVSFIKDGERAMTNAIKEHNIDYVFLWSICPETYSYTYYESIISGAIIITNSNSGNIAYDIEKNRTGIVFESVEELYRYFKNSQCVRNNISDFNNKYNSNYVDYYTNDKIIKFININAEVKFLGESKRIKIKKNKIKNIIIRKINELRNKY